MEKQPCKKCSKTGYVVCHKCKGSGTYKDKTGTWNCRHCGGGMIFSGSGKLTCDSCQGTGYKYK